MLSNLVPGGGNVGHHGVPVVFDHSWGFASWPSLTWTDPLCQLKPRAYLSTQAADGWWHGQGRQGGWSMKAFCFALVFLVTGIYFKVTLSPLAASASRPRLTGCPVHRTWALCTSYLRLAWFLLQAGSSRPWPSMSTGPMFSLGCLAETQFGYQYGSLPQFRTL